MNKEFRKVIILIVQLIKFKYPSSYTIQIFDIHNNNHSTKNQVQTNVQSELQADFGDKFLKENHETLNDYIFVA